MKALVHSTQFETMFDCRGITSLSSGTAPHNPAENRIVVQNSDLVEGMTTADDEACRKAAEQSLHALKKWISANYFAGDQRAEKSLNFALNEE